MLTRREPQIAKAIFVFLVSAFATACIPTSENPIIVSDQAQNNNDLVGVWYGAFDEDDDAFFMHLLRPGDSRDESYPGGMDILMIQHGEGGEDSGWGIAYGLTAEVGGKNFLSVEYRIDTGVSVEDEMVGYHLFLYDKPTHESFTLRAIEEDALEELVSDGTLEGFIEPGRFGSVRLTATSAELVSYLETADMEELFQEDFGTFIRRE